MSVTRVERDGGCQLLSRQAHPGVIFARFSGDGPLVRAVPAHYGATLHVAGRSRWTSGRTAWASEPGTLSVKVPGEASVERARDGRFDYRTVLFEAGLVDEAREALGHRVVAPRAHTLERRDPLARPLLELHRRLSEDAAPQALDEAVCEALSALVGAVCAPRGSELERRPRWSAPVARARSLLDERLTETVGLEELAAHARLDKFRLCRAFREEVGLPPHAYVTHRRVARAQGLLARGVSQAEVAVRVGFYDQSLLHRHFKRMLGLTPGAFVRGARGDGDAGAERVKSS